MAIFTSLFNEYVENQEDRTSKVVEISNFMDFYVDLNKDISTYTKNHDISKSKYLGYNFLNIKIKGTCPNQQNGGNDLKNFIYIVVNYFHEYGIRYGLDFSEAKIEQYTSDCFAVEPMPEYLILPAGDDARVSKAGSLPQKRPYFMAYSNQVKCDGEWLYSDDQDGVAIRYVGPSKKVVVPKKFSHRMDGIFDICDWVEELEFPSHLASTFVPHSCFMKMRNLKKLKFANGVTDIGFRAALNLFNLEEVEFPNTLTSIGEECFMGCSNLRSVKLPKSLSNLDKKVFANCVNLKSVDFHKEMPLEEIKDETFFNCTSLKEIVLPDSVEYISDYAFENCVSLEKITATNVNFFTNINSFTNCKNLKEIINNEKCFSTLYALNPMGLSTEALNNLLSDKTSDGKKLLSFYLTCSIDELDDFAAKGLIMHLKLTGKLDNKAFQKILDWIPKQSASAWGFDFSECEFEDLIPEDYMSYSKNKIQVHYVILPPSGKEYCHKNSFDTDTTCIYNSDVAHRKGYWITDPTETKGIKCICAGVLLADSSKNITSIEKDAFQVRNLYIGEERRDAGWINIIHIPENMSVIHEESFSNIKKTPKIYVPKGVKEIQNRAFAFSKSLEKIVISDSVQKIGNDILKDCESLKEIRTSQRIWEIIKRIGGIPSDVLSNINFVDTGVYEENTETDFRLHFEDKDFCYNFEIKSFDPSKIKKFDHVDTIIISFTGLFTKAFLDKFEQWANYQNARLLLDLSQASYGANIEKFTIQKKIGMCIELIEPGNFKGAEELKKQIWCLNKSVIFYPEKYNRKEYSIGLQFLGSKILEEVLPETYDGIYLGNTPNLAKINIPKNLICTEDPMAPLQYLREEHKTPLMQNSDRNCLKKYMADIAEEYGLNYDSEFTQKNDFVLLDNGRILLHYYGDADIIKIPDGVEVIAPYTFFITSHIKKIIVPKSVKRICSYMFITTGPYYSICDEIEIPISSEQVKIEKEALVGFKKISIGDNVLMCDKREVWRNERSYSDLRELTVANLSQLEHLRMPEIVRFLNPVDSDKMYEFRKKHKDYIHDENLNYFSNLTHNSQGTCLFTEYEARSRRDEPKKLLMAIKKDKKLQEATAYIPRLIVEFLINKDYHDYPPELYKEYPEIKQIIDDMPKIEKQQEMIEALKKASKGE